MLLHARLTLRPLFLDCTAKRLELLFALALRWGRGWLAEISFFCRRAMVLRSVSQRARVAQSVIFLIGFAGGGQPFRALLRRGGGWRLGRAESCLLSDGAVVNGALFPDTNMTSSRVLFGHLALLLEAFGARDGRGRRSWGVGRAKGRFFRRRASVAPAVGLDASLALRAVVLARRTFCLKPAFTVRLG